MFANPESQTIAGADEDPRASMLGAIGSGHVAVRSAPMGVPWNTGRRHGQSGGARVESSPPRRQSQKAALKIG